MSYQKFGKRSQILLANVHCVCIHLDFCLYPYRPNKCIEHLYLTNIILSNKHFGKLLLAILMMIIHLEIRSTHLNTKMNATLINIKSKRILNEVFFLI